MTAKTGVSHFAVPGYPTAVNLAPPRSYVDRQGYWGVGAVRTVRPPHAFGLDTAHASAPSVVLGKNGTLYMVYRQGTDHFTSRDGVFMMSKSVDLGRSWSAPVQILTLQPTFDLQGQGISESRDGTKLYLSYFKATAALGAAGVFFRTSLDGGTSWSAETRIDSTLPYAATTDVIIELDNGDLVMAYYGRSGAETFDSCWIARSTNGGTSWSSTRIANGQTASLHFDEPVIARRGTTGLITYRYGGIQSIGTMQSTDNLVTWSAGVERFPGTGKAHSFWIDSTTVACIFRRISNGDAVIRYSRDMGATWSPTRLVDPVYYPSGWMLYSASTEITPGVHFVAFAQERGDAGASPGTSRIYFTAAALGGTQTPFGLTMRQVDVTADARSELLFSTSFEQPDGALHEPWSAVINNGAATTAVVADGAMSPGTLNNFTIVRTYLRGVADCDISADILTATGSGSAAGIVFRQTANGTFLVFVAEGAITRLYAYAAGTPTLLASSAAMTTQFDVYNRYRVIARGNNVWCFYNDWQMINHVLSAGNQTTYGGGNYHGVKLFPTAGANTSHKCRGFSVRA